MSMPIKGAPETAEQRPTWNGPPENRPAGYLPADDHSETHRDAAGETLAAADHSSLSDAVSTEVSRSSREDRIRDRAHQLWQQDGQLDGNHQDHWLQAEHEIDEEGELSQHPDVTQPSEVDRRPREEFPPFDDPAFSPEPAQPSVQSDSPEGSGRLGVKAALNPATEKTSGAGPAIAERSKDAQALQTGRQPGAYKKT